MKQDSLIKGTIILAAAAFIARFLGLLQKVPLQHMLGDEGMATYGIAYSVYGMLLIVATAGIPSTLSKMISERYALGHYAEARRVYRAAVMFALVGGVLSAGLLYGAAPFYAEHIAEDPQAALAIRAIAPALLIFPLIAIMRGYFQGRQMMIAGGTSQILEQILRVVTAVALAFILLSLGYDNEVIAAGASFGAVTGAVAALAVMLYFERRMRRSDTPRRTITQVEFRRPQLSYRTIYSMILRLSIPISLISLTVPMVYFIDISTVISLLKNKAGYTAEGAKEALGILTGKAQSLAGIPPILAIALSTSIIPVISSAFARKKMAEVNDKASLALRLSLISGMPLVLVLVVLAEPTIGFLFSTADGWETAALLTASSLFQIMMMTSSAILMGLGQTRKPVRFVVVGIIVKLACSFMLAPLFGIYGIVLATLLCFVVIMLLNLASLRKTVQFQILGDRWGGFMRTTLVTSIIGAGLSYITSTFTIWTPTFTSLLRLALISPVLLLIYAVCLFKYGVVTSRDLSNFPALARKLLKPFERLMPAAAKQRR